MLSGEGPALSLPVAVWLSADPPFPVPCVLSALASVHTWFGKNSVVQVVRSHLSQIFNFLALCEIRKADQL